jgi:hypothetical protein
VKSKRSLSVNKQKTASRDRGETGRLELTKYREQNVPGDKDSSVVDTFTASNDIIEHASGEPRLASALTIVPRITVETYNTYYLEVTTRSRR